MVDRGSIADGLKVSRLEQVHVEGHLTIYDDDRSRLSEST